MFHCEDVMEILLILRLRILVGDLSKTLFYVNFIYKYMSSGVSQICLQLNSIYQDYGAL